MFGIILAAFLRQDTRCKITTYFSIMQIFVSLSAAVAHSAPAGPCIRLGQCFLCRLQIRHAGSRAQRAGHPRGNGIALFPDCRTPPYIVMSFFLKKRNVLTHFNSPGIRVRLQPLWAAALYQVRHLYLLPGVAQPQLHRHAVLGDELVDRLFFHQIIGLFI